MEDDLAGTLGRVFGTRNASARSTAALLSNPACERRAVLDAGRVDLVSLAERLGAPAQFGQSPFAIVLSCSGERCRITTKTIPLSAGIALKNSCSAQMLPADPPSPTIGSVW